MDPKQKFIEEYKARKRGQVSPTPAPAPQQSQLPPITTQRTPDWVDMYKSPESTVVNQYMGENPNHPVYGYGAEGHAGIDTSNPDTRMTNPIGGINIVGQAPGYGDFQVVVGGNEKDLADMDKKTEDEIRNTVVNYMMQGPKDIRGLQIPGKNITLQAHLAKPASAESRIATGSADLQMGGSGGWDPHGHIEVKDTQGQMRDIQDMLKKKYTPNPAYYR